MKTRWTPTKTAIVLALCAGAVATPGFAAAQTGVAPPVEKPAATKTPAMTVLPGEDFFTYANGDWLAKTEIPADRGSWSAMGALAEDTNTRIAKMIEDVGADKNASAEARKVADFYASYMDEAGIEKRGLAPIKPMLTSIAGIKDKAALVRALGGSIRADVDPLNSTNFFTENLFGLWVAQGLTEPSRNLPYLLQGGLGLPDRAYYLENNARMAELRTKYQQHIAAMLKLAGMDRSDERAARVFELELALAQTHATREDSANIQKSNNVWTMKEFAAKAPGIDWKAFFKAAGLDKQERFQVYHPTAITGAARLLADADVATWRDYLAFHKLNQYASLLPKAISDQRFEFTGKTLSGTPQQSARWKRALGATNNAMDEAVGKIYVAKYFPAENKARVQAMVANIIDAFSRRIEKLDWMAPATRAQAQAKVKGMYVGIGYPEKWKSYEGLNIVAGDAFGNTVRAEEFHYKQELAKLGRKPERTEWAMPPQLVNAVNLPLQNAMNFPAAILQPPFFDPKGSDAANYGAIGSIIGHEISHSFDDQGAQFDAQGRLRDWWTKEDLAHFKTASNKLVEQYGTYKPFPDLAVNGQLTLSENLADLAGVAAAYDAFKTTPSGKTPDADRQFFTGFAQGWRSKAREASLRRAVLTDGHAPSQYRTYIVRNLDAWYSAFDVKPGQALYLAPQDRVKIW
ncbi:MULTISPECIES: M13 family metallopeptidase [unclassified Massilia]|uniref:M13 family metallopeptidase n=1 Tax=unclassified Massilia TaxID=2609279 RepID=UPI001786E51D|nr:MULTISPECIES: M13 family metallopeptidase [unclassified Massilia]MBD8531950.1 M13 family metallopeptidase [Massilia sp. CFBP 13647]MBD8675436.1 M13 family metallopeptidase [Massilia sp. CFBP 13721]